MVGDGVRGVREEDGMIGWVRKRPSQFLGEKYRLGFVDAPTLEAVGTCQQIGLLLVHPSLNSVIQSTWS